MLTLQSIVMILTLGFRAPFINQDQISHRMGPLRAFNQITAICCMLINLNVICTTSVHCFSNIWISSDFR